MNSIKFTCSCGISYELIAGQAVQLCEHTVFRGGKNITINIVHSYIPNDGPRPGKRHKPGKNSWLARAEQ